MKSLHIFLIAVLALSTLVVFGNTINPSLFIVALFFLIIIGASVTAKAIKKGR